MITGAAQMAMRVATPIPAEAIAATYQAWESAIILPMSIMTPRSQRLMRKKLGPRRIQLTRKNRGVAIARRKHVNERAFVVP